MKNIKLTNSEIDVLKKAQASLLSNRNETIAEHSANNKKFSDVAEKYGVSSQVIWDMIRAENTKK